MSVKDGFVVRDEHVDLGCPHCDALGDEFCVTPDGTVREDHQARIKARGGKGASE